MTTNRTRADTARLALLEAILPHAVFDGWNEASLAAAAKDAGMSTGEVQLYLTGGVLDLIGFWSLELDRQARETIEDADLAAMKIRERVTFAVRRRLEAIGSDEEAARKARARLLLPDAAGLGAKLVWTTSDMIWRALGDPSTDFNFYTKRMTLSAVYTSSLTAWLADMSEDKAEAAAFLDRRIGNVMQFEKVKAQVRKATSGLPDPAGLLAKLRYGLGRG